MQVRILSPRPLAFLMVLINHYGMRKVLIAVSVILVMVGLVALNNEADRTLYDFCMAHPLGVACEQYR